MIPNQFLKYSVEKLLFEANPKGLPYFRDTHFNKMIFLIYESLKKENIDLKLPYCWYKHGTLIHMGSFYNQVGLPLNYYITKKKSTRKMTSISKNDLDSDIKSIIDRVVIDVVSRYKKTKDSFKKGYINQLLDDDYKYAPYEFQRIFKRRFEKYLFDFKTPVRKQIPKHVSFSLSEVEQINEYLDELMCYFPDQMECLNETYLDWDDTVRMSLDCEHDSFLKLVDEFWDIFSKHLRIVHYENIPNAEISRWESNLSVEEFPHYQNLLLSKRKGLLEIWNSNFTLDNSTLNVVKKMNKLSFEDAIRGK